MALIRWLAFLPLGFLVAEAALAADITLEVRGPQPSGRINAALYDSAANFLRKPLAAYGGDLKDGVATLRFPNLAPGNYAISAYLDGNGNHKLDTNSMGIPIEPYAFSRSVKGRTGPPTFEDVAFVLEPSGTKLVLEMRK